MANTGGIQAPGRNRNRNRNQNRNRPNQQGRNKQNQKAKGNNQGKGKAKGKNKVTGPQYKGLFQPREIQEGPRLRKSIQQAVNFQMRPALRQTNRALNELNREQAKDLDMNSRLGQQAGANAAKYFQDLAARETARIQASQAQGTAFTGAVAAQGEQAAQGVQAAGAAAQASLGPAGGEPIASRDRLAEMIALQESGVAQQNAALNAQAQGNASNWNSFLTALAGASGIRGGEVQGEIARQIGAQSGEIRRQYGSDISKLRGTKRELLLQRPEIARQTLNELRESERNYDLSLGALNLQRSAAKAGPGGEAKASAKAWLQYQRQKHRLRLQEMKIQGATQAELDAADRAFREKEMEWQEKNYGGKGGTRDGWVNQSKAFSLLRGMASARALTEGMSFRNKDGQLIEKSGKEARKAAYDNLRKQGVSDKIARKVIKRRVRQFKRQKKGPPAPGKKYPGPY